MKTNLVDKHCKNERYITPPHIIEAVKKCFGRDIDLDPATEENNPTGAKFSFTEKDNGLLQDWDISGLFEEGWGRLKIFINPPYGKRLPDWIEKITREKKEHYFEIIALLPANRFKTAYFQDFLSVVNCMCFVRKRLAFHLPTGEKMRGNPYASVIYGINTDAENFKDAFADIGKCVAIK